MWAEALFEADASGENAPIAGTGRSRADGIGEERRVPEATQQHSSSHERPGGPHPLASTADEVVLSPRVIDRLAFDEYVRLLRAEIERATSESELLARRAEAGAVILDQLERFIGENSTEIERAAEVLAGIDERAESTRALLDEIDRRAGGLDRASRDAERAIEARAEAFQHRLRTIVDTAMDRFEETEDQLTARAASARRELLDRLEQMRSRAEETVSRLDDRTSALAGDAEAMLARAETRLETLRGPAKELLAEIDAKGAKLDARLDERLASLAAALESTTEREDALRSIGESVIERAASACESTLEELRSTIASETRAYEAKAEESARSIREEVDAARTGIRAVEQRLTDARTTAERTLTSDELRAVLDECRDADSAVKAAAKQIESLTSQAETARRELAVAIVEGANRIDALDERASALRSAGSAEADRLASLLDAVREPSDGAREWVEALRSIETDTPHALLEGLIERVREETRAEVEAEFGVALEMASASLASVCERVARLERSAGGAEPKPASKKRTSKKTASKKAATKKAGAKGASPKRAHSETGAASLEPKPEPPAPARKKAS